MSRELRIEDFVRHSRINEFGHYYEHTLPNGDRICMESCMDGYCVARYDAGSNYTEHKRCTNLGHVLEFPMFSDGTEEVYDRARIKALAYANTLV